MSKHDFTYFAHEGISNLFSHGFMSFAAIGITVACLVIMGTFSLVAYNAQVQLDTLESEYEIVAFLEEGLSREEEQAIGRKLEALDNVASCTYISREDAMDAFADRNLDDYMRQHLEAKQFRNRYAVSVHDLKAVRDTAAKVEELVGEGNVRVDEDIAGGFIMLRNVAGIVCIALIAILFVVSVFIISNTIKLTTFDRRDEIAIMKMVGATNGFIRWPFVYEGFMLGLLSAVIAFGLQWLLYVTVARSIDISDTLKLLNIVPFEEIWGPVAGIFGLAGIIIGVGGSLTAIRKFLQV